MKTTKRILAMLMALTLLFACFATTASATRITQFEDAPAPGSWSYDGLNYMIDMGYMSGMSQTVLAPNDTTTRAMLVQLLYAMEGWPKVTGNMKFTDVEAGKWYYNPILWASQNGIVTGVSETKFNPNGNVTREQIAVFLLRYAMLKHPHTLDEGVDTRLGWNDDNQISSWAHEGVCWAATMWKSDLTPILTGKSQTRLDPKGYATRAEVATMLYRYTQLPSWAFNEDDEPFTLQAATKAAAAPVLSVSTVDETGKAIAGAKLILAYHPAGVKDDSVLPIAEWTSTTSAKTFTDVPDGSMYYIYEVAAPENYERAIGMFNEMFRFQWNKDADVNIKIAHEAKDEMFTLSAVSAPSIQGNSIALDVVDENGKSLSGATMVFAYHPANAKDDSVVPIAQWVTDGQPKVFTNLPVGSMYFIYEASAPEGYDKAVGPFNGMFRFQWNADKSYEAKLINVRTAADPVSLFSVNATPTATDSYEVSINATDMNGKPLSGARMILAYHPAGMKDDSVIPIASWTSNGKPKTFIDLPAASMYYVYESEAPAGYQRSVGAFNEMFRFQWNSDQNAQITILHQPE